MMEFTGQQIAQKIMKDKLHRLSNKIEEAIKGTTVLQTSGPRTTTLDLKGLLAKTLEVKVSLQLLSVSKKCRIKLNFAVIILDYAQ